MFFPFPLRYHVQSGNESCNGAQVYISSYIYLIIYIYDVLLVDSLFPSTRSVDSQE